MHKLQTILKTIYLTFISSVRIVFSKVLNQLDLLLVSFQINFCEKPNLPIIHCNMLLLSAEQVSLYVYLFDEKCHPIRTLFGTILLLNLNICASLYSPIIMANYAGCNF